MNKKLKRWRLYDIKYKEPSSAPTDITLDLDGFPWSSSVSVGPHNLNYKAFRAIKEVTGCDAITCKFDVIWLD